MQNNNPTLTLEREDSSTTLEVIEVTAQEVGDKCTEGQSGHESRNEAGEIVSCHYVPGRGWEWVLGRR